jgi:hypothetical protein
MLHYYHFLLPKNDDESSIVMERGLFILFMILIRGASAKKKPCPANAIRGLFATLMILKWGHLQRKALHPPSALV